MGSLGNFKTAAKETKGKTNMVSEENVTKLMYSREMK